MKKTLAYFLISLYCAAVTLVFATPTPGPKTVSINGSTHEVINTEVKTSTGQIIYPTVDPHIRYAGWWSGTTFTMSAGTATPTATATATATPTATPTPSSTFTPTPTP